MKYGIQFTENKIILWAGNTHGVLRFLKWYKWRSSWYDIPNTAVAIFKNIYSDIIFIGIII